jgi:hypothetical protein
MRRLIKPISTLLLVANRVRQPLVPVFPVVPLIQRILAQSQRRVLDGPAGEKVVCGQVRSGLFPGGRWIRTIGTPSERQRFSRLLFPNMRAHHRRLRKRSPPRPAATSSSCRSRSVERRTRQLGDRQVPPTAAHHHPFALITALCFFRVCSISCSCAVALSRGRAPTLANRLIFGAQFGSQRSRRRRAGGRRFEPSIPHLR